MLKNVKKNKGLVLACLFGFFSYYMNLWFMDALQTLKYVYMLMAIFEVILIENNKTADTKQIKKSKYIK